MNYRNLKFPNELVLETIYHFSILRLNEEKQIYRNQKQFRKNLIAKHSLYNDEQSSNTKSNICKKLNNFFKLISALVQKAFEQEKSEKNINSIVKIVLKLFFKKCSACYLNLENVEALFAKYIRE